MIPPASPYVYVDTPEALRAVAPALQAAPRLAVDIEADSLHHYFAKVCLIQISAENPAGQADPADPVPSTDYIIDPLALPDVDALLEALIERPLVFHGCDYDLRMLRAAWGFEPRGEVRDTMLGAQLLGIEAFGFAALVERYFGAKLPKTAQRADWSQRPLPESMRSYARDDTRYLLPLVARLEAEIIAAGREAAWLEWSRRAATGAAFEPAPDAERAWRVKGWAELDPRGLAILREIWRWREAEAQRADIPTFKILGAETMIRLSTWVTGEGQGQDLDLGPSLPRHCVGRRRRALAEAIERAREIPSSRWPSRRLRSVGVRGERPDPKVVARLQAARDAVARSTCLANAILAPRAALEAIAAARPTTDAELAHAGGLMEWQASLLAAPLLAVLQGDGHAANPCAALPAAAPDSAEANP